ncbi:MAG: LytTR family DNA-binding domain-containing protein [Prevotella sp.]|nr:LytTR family DNA-binding domain-containing protein [Prevotella sp.]
MKRFPTCMLLDYIGFGIATMAILWLSKPFNIENALLRDGVFQQSIEDGLVTMLAYWLTEVFVAYALRLPCDYLRPWLYQIKRMAVLFAIAIPLDALLTAYYFNTANYGIFCYAYPWLDHDGNGYFYTTRWMVQALQQKLFFGVLFASYWLVITWVRMQRLVITELLQLNSMLEGNQRQHETIKEIKEEEAVVFQNGGSGAFSALPSEIIYIESVANYIIVAHFHNNEPRQTRLRGTLHYVEETLKNHDFIVHIHRAFLVNVNYVTEVTGNSNGYRIRMLGMDNLLPVSRANIETFKQAMKVKN